MPATHVGGPGRELPLIPSAARKRNQLQHSRARLVERRVQLPAQAFGHFPVARRLGVVFVDEQGRTMLFDKPRKQSRGDPARHLRPRNQPRQRLLQPRLAASLRRRRHGQERRIVTQIVRMREHCPKGRCVPLVRVHNDVSADRL